MDHLWHIACMERMAGRMEPGLKSPRVYNLFVLNIALQLFDAVATYEGLKIGLHEGNPILVNSFACFGIVPALLLFKAKAFGLLFLLNRNPAHYLVAPAFSVLATVYFGMSLLPWTWKFFSLLLHLP